ncbi:UDP-N-acetylglucosamine 2-epimerase [Sphingomonas sp. SRS2]|uniref:UDP-N-acetylglucosamine 2-epimerase n=1 Tax=Sphingomonas sp. SRS2 TaxID=133190 RepID=UPI0006184230|nr:UDP-N-acetylglucosamine 2-epimerase [Sphingomonas sp. SRS2]KKC24369.1 UDP-N-acetylglucosamine 2-epimerase [Sphingomonas sp. SRS2]
MRKIAVVVTARPSYSRIKTVLEAVRNHPDLELQLIVSASALLSRYGSAVDVIEHDGFEIAARAYTVLEGDKPELMAKTTGMGMIELATVFGNLKPDIVVTVADRYETMATAVTAAYMNIPLAHVQGGEITGNIDEKVRHAITKLADYHLVASDKAAERVLRLGEDAASVFVTGCPSIDLAVDVLENPAFDFDPYAKYGGVGAAPDLSSGYLVVLQHPVTTDFTHARDHILETLHAVRACGLPSLCFWPNTDAGSDGTSSGIRYFREAFGSENIHFFKNMEPQDFLRLLRNSRAIVGNSSVAIRECAYLGVPAINIGDRQVGRDRGLNVMDVAYDRDDILRTIEVHCGKGRHAQDLIYGDGTAGAQIADILARVELRFHKMLPF